jgi:ribosomal protein L3 glutamine methyltransferase
MTVTDWIERVEAGLQRAGLHYGHGTDNPGDEACWLVLHAIGAPLDGSYDAWGTLVNKTQEVEIQRLTAARISDKVPLAYLIGRARFAGLEFEVSSAVLVPRSPIAALILEQFSPWVVPEATMRILDLCTGCGCIAVAAAVHMPWVTVDAVDLSRAALDVARRNVESHGVGDRVKLIESDMFQSLAACRYDLIVANPPYVPVRAVDGLPAEYRAEPRMGLESGPDGLQAALVILAEAGQRLADGGVLVCEVGESEGRLAALLPTVPFLWLEFAAGGSGVFVLTRQQLDQSRPVIDALLEERKDVA